MPKITDAVILMAGSGSRLRASVPKPLVPISGRPLISHIIERLFRAGVRKLHVIVGHESDRLLAGLKPLIPDRMELHPIKNPLWEKQNGISLLCADGHMNAPFVLAMADHLFDASVLNILLEQAEPDSLNLAVDRKIESIFDLSDAMKVRTRNGFVAEIGKSLTSYDAIDTGLFVCPSEIFSYLNAARKNDDCSLADGVRLMAQDEKVRAIDIGDAWWQDVDTDAMFARAEEELSARGTEPRFARER
jgi:1L-myo-inositol 1-phosphate cytidylyltransferase